MNEIFKNLENQPRLLLEVKLEPVYGQEHRFQPTGFPDLGPAIYERPDGKRMLLVESAQSIANHLEGTCLDCFSSVLIKELEGLPYISVKLEGVSEEETSSLVEAHRINSPFIITVKDFQEAFKKKANYAKGQKMDWGKIAGTIFYYDPNSLLHGVFMANLEDGRIKIPRAITGFIEAEGVREQPVVGRNSVFLIPQAIFG